MSADWFAHEVALTTHPKGVILPVHAHPHARRDALVGVHDGALKVDVTAPPDRGQANLAILKLLAKRLECPRADLSIASGATARTKRILVEQLDVNALRCRLDALCDS